MHFLEFLKLFLQFFYHLVRTIPNVFKPNVPKCVRGQLALITGGANGIGKATALILARKGCNIAIVDLDAESGRKTEAEISRLGVRVKFFTVNIGKLDEVERLKVAIEAELGPVDLLINNAGIFITKNITEEEVPRLEQMLNTNLVAHLWTVRVFLPGMIERKRGHIVGVSSVAGLMGAPEAVLYSTTKFGVRGFMEALSAQLYVDGHSDYIKTSTVFPYFVATRTCVKNVVKDGIMLSKIYSPEDCGHAIVDAVVKEKEITTLPSIAYIFYIM